MGEKEIRVAIIAGIFVVVAAFIALMQPFVARMADSFFPTITPIRTPLGPTIGFIETITLEQNFVENGQEGLRIHLKFSVENMENISCRIIAYFEDSSGNMLKDTNGIYVATGGQVSVGKDFLPERPFQGYNEYLLFIPYSEFHLTNGVYDLRFIVKLYNYSNRTFFASSEYYSFRYEQK